MIFYILETKEKLCLFYFFSIIKSKFLAVDTQTYRNSSWNHRTLQNHFNEGYHYNREDGLKIVRPWILINSSSQPLDQDHYVSGGLLRPPA